MRINRFYLYFSLVLVLAAALRFVSIDTTPGWEWDEGVYLSIGQNVAENGIIKPKAELGTDYQVYLFHPHPYFYMLGGWFKLFGAGITQARVLTAASSLITISLMTAISYLIMKRWALLVTFILATDGWMIFSSRVSWFENHMLVLISAGMLFYLLALQRKKLFLYALAGMFLAGGILFKHVGIYIALCCLINWRFNRRDQTSNDGHILMGAIIVLSLYFYAVLMITEYPAEFVNHYWVQIKRTLGLQEARGLNNSPLDILQALWERYWIFAGMVLVVATAMLGLLSEVIHRLRLTSVEEKYVFSWAGGSVLFFASIRLQNPHYYQMVFIPLCLFAVYYAYKHWNSLTLVAVKRFIRLTQNPYRRQYRRALIVFMSALTLINAGTFAYRFILLNEQDKAFESLKAYMETQIPSTAILLTEESVGVIAPQQYYNLGRYQAPARLASIDPDYIIVLVTLTQKPPDSEALNTLIANSERIASFEGFKGTFIIYKVDKSYKYLVNQQTFLNVTSTKGGGSPPFPFITFPF